MNFANVKNIVIPEGNVTKIHETNSGRVLWEKSIINVDTKLIIELTTASGEKYYNCYHYNNEKGRIESVALPSTFPKLDILAGNNFYATQFTAIKASVGDSYTAYYVNNDSELIDFPNNAHLANDAEWQSGIVRIISVHQDGTPVEGSGFFKNDSNIGYECMNEDKGTKAMYYSRLFVSPTPVIYSSNYGSSISIVSITNDPREDSSYYIAQMIFDNDFSKSDFPYISVLYQTVVTSSSTGIKLPIEYTMNNANVCIGYRWLYER